MTRKNRRFVLAAVAASAMVVVALLHMLSIRAWTPGAYGNWIPLYRHPMEIILVTLVTVAVVFWLYQWYRRDPVQHTLRSLDDDEKRVLLKHLLEADYASAKRKHEDLLAEDDSADSADWVEEQRLRR